MRFPGRKRASAIPVVLRVVREPDLRGIQAVGRLFYPPDMTSWTRGSLAALAACVLLCAGAAGCGSGGARGSGTAEKSASPVGRVVDRADEEGRPYREVAQGEAPEVGVEVRPDADGSWDVRLTVRRFRFSPAGAAARPAAGRGLAHLLVDGRLVGRLRTPDYRLPARLVPRGTHHVTARLYADDGTVWAVAGRPVQSTADITASGLAPGAVPSGEASSPGAVGATEGGPGSGAPSATAAGAGSPGSKEAGPGAKGSGPESKGAVSPSPAPTGSSSLPGTHGPTGTASRAGAPKGRADSDAGGNSGASEEHRVGPGPARGAPVGDAGPAAAARVPAATAAPAAARDTVAGVVDAATRAAGAARDAGTAAAGGAGRGSPPWPGDAS